MLSGLPYLWGMLSGMVFGVVFTLSSVHWLMIWAGLEINLICFIPLLISNKIISEAEAAVKYYIFQSLGSCLLVAGSLYSYSVSFTWEVSSCDQGCVLLAAGLLLKLGAAPFHWWFPGVMAGIGWGVCLLLVTWQKAGPLFLLLGLDGNSLFVVVSFSACLSALVGGVGGLNQTQVRGLLAYSSIGHLGWLLVSSLSSASLTFFYFCSYTVISVSLFYSIWCITGGGINTISGLGSVPSTVCVLVSLLSLGGIPPMLGFVPKWLVISSCLSYNPVWWVLVALLIGSLLNIYYYLCLGISFFLSSSSSIFVVSSTRSWGIVYLTAIVHLVGGLALCFV